VQFAAKINKSEIERYLTQNGKRNMNIKLKISRPRSGQIFVENGRTREHSTPKGSHNTANIIFHKHTIPLE